MPLPDKNTRRRTGAGSIYAIGAADSPYVKIGSTSTSVKQRLKSLQTGQPTKLHIVATQMVETDLQRIERQIHKFLAAERYHGEWFACMLDAEALQKLILRAVAYLADADQQVKEKQAQRKSQAATTRTEKPNHSEPPWENRLAEYRSTRQLTRPQLGAALGISPVTIWRWETQAVSLSHDHLLMLARFFQVRAIDIIPALGQIPIIERAPAPSSVPLHPPQPFVSVTPQLSWEF